MPFVSVCASVYVCASVFVCVNAKLVIFHNFLWFLSLNWAVSECVCEWIAKLRRWVFQEKSKAQLE